MSNNAKSIEVNTIRHIRYGTMAEVRPLVEGFKRYLDECLEALNNLIDKTSDKEIIARYEYGKKIAENIAQDYIDNLTKLLS